MERSADWIDKAQGDLEHARHDLTAGFHDWACFSAHQAAEKALQGVVSPSSQLMGKVVLGEGAEIVESAVRGPAVIGSNSLVENSYVGPFTAIGSDCVIRNGELEFSIMMDGARILDTEVRIEQSIIGKEAVIVKGHTRPKAQKFILGDQSTVELA